jgi:uncharacterized damage-inducible protein DinB
MGGEMSIEDLLLQLETMPEELRAAAARMPESRWRVPPAAGGFSLVEQMWHLADLEAEGYGPRIERLLSETGPHLPDFEGDRIAAERDYKSLSLGEGLARFTFARARNLARLRSLSEEAWTRAGTQEGVGAVTLSDIPRMMVEHDTSHRAEITALLAGDRMEPGPAHSTEGGSEPSDSSHQQSW